MSKELRVLETREILSNQVFNVYGTPEEPLFLASDVARMIEYNVNKQQQPDTSQMLKTIDEDEKIKIYCQLSNAYNVPKPSLSSGYANRMFLTEDGVYEVLFQSRKPIAKQFKKEVKKILKDIRKNGGHISDTNQMVETFFGDISPEQKQSIGAMFDNMQKTQEKLRLAEKTIETKEVVIDELTENFISGLTITQSMDQFNGVSKRGILKRLEEDGFIRSISRWKNVNGDSVCEAGYECTGKSKGWFQPNIVQGQIEHFRRGHITGYFIDSFQLFVTSEGMKKLYNRYKANKLPMVKTWNGKYFISKTSF